MCHYLSQFLQNLEKYFFFLCVVLDACVKRNIEKKRNARVRLQVIAACECSCKEILQPGDVLTLVSNLIVLLFQTENLCGSYYESVKFMTIPAFFQMANGHRSSRPPVDCHYYQKQIVQWRRLVS